MLKQNILLFLRGIKKNKGTFMVNVLGLGLGIAAFLVLFLYVYNDATYNHFNKNLAQIYRVQEEYEGGAGIQTKGLLLPEVLKSVPEVETGTRIFDWDGQRLSVGDKAFFENIDYVDTDFFSIFSFPFVEGSPKAVLDEKFNAVISAQMAQKYFGNQSALGKQFHVGFGDQYLTVAGVVDVPANSSIQFSIMASYETGETLMPWMKDVHDWYNTFSQTYIQLKEGVDPQIAEAKLQPIAQEHFLPEGKAKPHLGLLPFSKFHEIHESNTTLIVILSVVALGILAIALVNFVNLMVTKTLSRTQEVGVKKVYGASKSQLFQQVLTESLATGLFALLFGLLVLLAFLPSFNQLFQVKLQFAPFQNPILLMVLLGIWLLIGVVSGLVPVVLWSKASLVEHLKGKVSASPKAGTARYGSLVLQFMIAMILLVGTFMVRRQVSYMMDKDPMFDKENVVTIQTDYWQYKDLDAASRNLKLLADEMGQMSNVEDVAFSGTVPGLYSENYNTFYPADKDGSGSISLRKAYVGKDFFKTFGIPIRNGNGFTADTTALKGTVILNKKAMDLLGYSEASDQIIREGSPTGEPYRIIGVVDNFAYQGIQRENQPLAHFFYNRGNYADWDYLTIRAKAGALPQVMEQLKNTWQKLLPDATLNTFFADEKLNNSYAEYIRVNQLIGWFSALAILLSCIGLLALSSYTIARRTKEIGIRKVNGATITEVITLLNKDFLKWVGVAFVLAVPLAWYGLHKWMEGFAQKTNLAWWVFALAGGIVVLIALLTVSWESLRAARTNPAKSLRTE